jgi:lipase maturation factor 1
MTNEPKNNHSGAMPPTYFSSRWVFLKVLALCYLAAFGSFWVQVDGLIGQQGILPVRVFLSEVQVELESKAFWEVPTLCWLNDSNGFLHLLCGAGVIFSILLLLDLIPLLCLALLWLLYLSLASVGQEFLGFQWDNLLLEAGFLALFLVPFAVRVSPSNENPPPKMFLFLFQWFLFRLMFSSGVVKLTSGDFAWRHLTALQFHYETQPLPTPLSWYFNQLPGWFQQLSCLYLFGVELIVPFFIFGPRRLRPWAFGFLISLQVLIALTGNYCFFNLLALGLCLFAFEDEAYPRWWKGRWAALKGKPKKPSRSWTPWITAPLAVLLIYLSLIQMLYTLGGRFPLPGFLSLPVQLAEPFRSVNSYGLFAVMTTTRPEIVVEGSRDGVQWLPYEFKWKAGDLGQAPRYVAPYQPRLDWQMWFAALGDYRDNPWFVNFLIRLLQGSPDVLNLLKTNPFPDSPPQFIRARLEQYHFTNFLEKAKTGQWWKKEDNGFYIPAFSLKDLQSR